MTQLVEFELEDSSTILVQTEFSMLASVPGSMPASRADEVVTRAAVTFEEALDKVRPAANSIIKKLRGLIDPPDEIEVEFGIKLSAEAGAIIAAAGVEANYKVTLKWLKQ